MMCAGYHSLSLDRCASTMDGVQVLLAAGLLFTVGFAGYVILDPGSTTDGLADWEIIDVCLDDHDGAIAHIHASLSVTISGNQIAVPGSTEFRMKFVPMVCEESIHMMTQGACTSRRPVLWMLQ